MNDHNWFEYTLFGAFLAWVFLFPTQHDSFKTATDYTLHCSGNYDTKNNICTGGWIHYEKRNYAASRQLQVVVREDQSGYVSTMKNCSVYDEDNWNCTTGSTYAFSLYGCNDGTCTESSDYPDVRHVSKWRYYFQAMLDWFNKPSNS